VNTKKVRSWLWHRLVFLADRISPEDAFRSMGMTVHLRGREGWVLDQKGKQGFGIWYRGTKDYEEHKYDGFGDEPVIGSTTISTGPGGITLSSDMTPEDVERQFPRGYWWGNR